MQFELIKEKYLGRVNTVRIGIDTPGDSGPKSVTIGGETAMPFLFDEGAMPNPPVVALEILDGNPGEWPQSIKEAYGDSIKDPVVWAVKCVRDFKVKVLCVRLQSAHPDYGSKSSGDIISILSEINNKTRVPLIIIGSGDDERDNDVLPKVSKAFAGRNYLFGIVTQKNYRSLTSACLADGHSLIAESPIDINIAKQVNILITDMGIESARIIMHPTTASLGYGMEYVYSIMERCRLAAFSGDRMLAMPFISFVGSETWKTKEAKDSGSLRGVNWEITTAVSMLQSGADLLVLRHPKAAEEVMKYIRLTVNNLNGGSRC